MKFAGSNHYYNVPTD